MLVGIGRHTTARTLGNKALNLSLMKQAGFAAPDGFVIDSDVMHSLAAASRKLPRIGRVLAGMKKSNIEETSAKVGAIVDTFEMPDELRREVAKRLKKGRRYAVRSSGLAEDLAEFSFAGQYKSFLGVSGADEICTKVIECYKSMYGPAILSYLVDNGLDWRDLRLAVIVQEMVEADVSGVAFSVNPLSGNDKEIVAEATRGLGENLVSGKVAPERYIYNWYDDAWVSKSRSHLLTRQGQQELMDMTLQVQKFFGYPVDIEFAIQSSRLYVLQARPVTKILYSGIPDQWTMADFKDGGVSAAVCTPLMWSLYEYIWEIKLKEFLLQAKMVMPPEMRKLGGMYFGRPYWNLSVAKTGMQRVPGYVEREFDNDLGITPYYTGRGHVTKISPWSLVSVLRMVEPLKRIYAEQDALINEHRAWALLAYQDYREQSGRKESLKELEQGWHKLVRDDYLRTEGTYFWQIFINTVRQTLIKDKLLKAMSYEEYLRLLSGLDNISHILPARDMWLLGRTIAGNRRDREFWRKEPVTAIVGRYKAGSTEHCLDEVRAFVEQYGYHSDKELDITYPRYFENIPHVVEMMKDAVSLQGENFAEGAAKQQKAYRKQLTAIRRRVPAGKYEEIVKRVELMRSLLWWREELRDTSTRMYYIIRIYTLKLAKMYVKSGALNRADDIFYLKIDDIDGFISGKLTAGEVSGIVSRNRSYFESFRNYDNPNEIGALYDGRGEPGVAGAAGGQEEPEAAGADGTGDTLSGVGCNSGSVTGTARVIEGLEDIGRLKPGDILVTKFTDTGWTSKFAIIKGVVTERGEILCHAAIVSREYGIPCVVCVKDATCAVKDGSTIRIDGTTGKIQVVGKA